MKLLNGKWFCHIAMILAAIPLDCYVIPATLAGILLVMVAPRLMADEIEPNLIQIIDTSNFPAPDTAGIVYLPSQDAFLISDSEINEMAIFEGSNIFKVDRYGTLLETFSTLSFSREPTGVTINPENNHCFFSDDDNYSIYEVDPGLDGVCLTADDSVTSFATQNDFGSNDPEDLTYGLDSLFYVDGSADRVYRIMPGANGVFDSVLTGDDLVSSFDTYALGVDDPEGIVFNSTDHTLFIVGRQNDLIIQTSIDGVLLNTINISTLNPNKPSGLALAPGSVDPSMTSLYMVTRGTDNGDDPDENDGMIYELEIPYLINTAPVLTLNGGNPLKLNLGDIFSDPEATAMDDRDGDLTDFIQVVSDVDTAVAGRYQVIYTVTDFDGKSASATRSVVVIDNTVAPLITLNGANPLNLNLGDTFSDPGVMAMDDRDGDLSASVQVVSDVDTAVAASYQITYRVTDFDGNRASATRSVVVIDNTVAPLITLNGDNPMNLNLGDIFSDPGVTAMDDRDGNLSASVQTVSDVDTAVAASYQVIYTVSDSDGNRASATRRVVVSNPMSVDIAPLITETSLREGGNGGSTDRVLLLLFTLAVLLRYQRRGKFAVVEAIGRVLQ